MQFPDRCDLHFGCAFFASLRVALYPFGFGLNVRTGGSCTHPLNISWRRLVWKCIRCSQSGKGHTYILVQCVRFFHALLRLALYSSHFSISCVGISSCYSMQVFHLPIYHVRFLLSCACLPASAMGAIILSSFSVDPVLSIPTANSFHNSL